MSLTVEITYTRAQLNDSDLVGRYIITALTVVLNCGSLEGAVDLATAQLTSSVGTPSSPGRPVYLIAIQLTGATIPRCPSQLAQFETGLVPYSISELNFCYYCQGLSG